MEKGLFPETLGQYYGPCYNDAGPGLNWPKCFGGLKNGVFVLACLGGFLGTGAKGYG